MWEKGVELEKKLWGEKHLPIAFVWQSYVPNLKLNVLEDRKTCK